MEAHQLTVWEAKERAGLLALETDEWQEKRLIAENPNTTADQLRALASRLPSYDIQLHHILRCAAVVAHPNTPPDLLLDLSRSAFCPDPFSEPAHPLTYPFARALSCNPVAPFLVLEMPDFWERVEWRGYEPNDVPTEVCRTLLAEPNVPTALVETLARHSREVVAQTARQHIALTGKIRTKTQRAAALEEARAVLRAPDRYGDLAEDNHSGILDPFALENQYLMGNSCRWRYRLICALHLPVTTEMTDITATNYGFEADAWGRSPLDLSHRLTHDGNRLVRWAAQSRLADPSFTFTWADEDAN